MFFRDTTEQDIHRALGFILRVADGTFVTLSSKGWGGEDYQSFLHKDHDGIRAWIEEQIARNRRLKVLIHYTDRLLGYQKPEPLDFDKTCWTAFQLPKEMLLTVSGWRELAPTTIVKTKKWICLGWRCQTTLKMHQSEEITKSMAKQMGRIAVPTCYIDVPLRSSDLARFNPGCVHPLSAYRPPAEQKALEREYEKAMAQTMSGRPPALSSDEYRAEPEQPKSRRLISTSFADIEEEQMNWLVPDTIPLGCLTLLGGLPDAGKSQITINLAATVSRGAEWPCGLGGSEPGDVLMLASEDGDAKTIKPRLEAAGADMRRIHGMRTRFSIGENLDELKELGESLPNLRLIIFDPISRYMSGKDANAVRDAVDNFNIWIDRQQIAAVAIRHPPKDAKPDVQSLFSGSAEEVRIARAAWFIVGGKAAGLPGRGYMLNAKGNILPDKRGFPYHIEGYTTRTGSITSRIVWGDERIDQTAQEFLQDLKKSGGRAPEPPKGSNRYDGGLTPEEWLHNQLLAADDYTVEAATVRAAGMKIGIYPTPLYEAKKRLNLIESDVPGGINNAKRWTLPR